MSPAGSPTNVGELAQHRRGIARHRVVLHDLDRAAPPDRLDHEVAREPARRGERRAELRHVLAVVAIGGELRPLPRVHDRARIADDLRDAHVDAGNEAERDRLDREARRVDDDTRAGELRRCSGTPPTTPRCSGRAPPSPRARPAGRAAAAACAATARPTPARGRSARSRSGAIPRPTPVGSSRRSAASRISCQVGHSCTGRPQPQRKLDTRPQSHSRLSSPMLKKPGSWPSRLASSVPPLRPLPARNSTLTSPGCWAVMRRALRRSHRRNRARAITRETGAQRTTGVRALAPDRASLRAVRMCDHRGVHEAVATRRRRGACDRLGADRGDVRRADGTAIDTAIATAPSRSRRSSCTRFTSC